MKYFIMILLLIGATTDLSASRRINNPKPLPSAPTQSQAMDKNQSFLNDQKLFMLFSSMLYTVRKMLREEGGMTKTDEYVPQIVDNLLAICEDVCRNARPAEARAKLIMAFMKKLRQGNHRVWASALWPA